MPTVRAGLLRCLAVFSVVATWGCDDPAPTAIDREPVRANLLTGVSVTEELSLKRLEEQEKERIKLEQERSKATYDSLKLVWDRFLKYNYSKTDSPYLMCDPLQYAADVKIIGPEGGDMSIGPHKLRIPKGALAKYAVITGEMPVTTMVDVKLSPHGLVFLKAVTLELSYKHCYRPHTMPHRAVYHDDRYNILEWPTSTDYAGDGLVMAWIKHFSGYALVTRYAK